MHMTAASTNPKKLTFKKNLSCMIDCVSYLFGPYVLFLGLRCRLSIFVFEVQPYVFVFNLVKFGTYFAFFFGYF